MTIGLPTFFALMLAALLVAAALLERVPPRMTAAAWLLVLVALLPTWLANADRYDWNWFVVTKVVSIILGCVWLCLGRAGSIRGRVFGFGVYGLLGANILEAVLIDGFAANKIAGLLVIAAMPRPSAARITDAGGRPTFEHATTWTWIAAYTVWNASFTYSNWNAAIFGRGIVLLLAPVLGALWLGPRRWLDLRCTTLAVFMATYATWFEIFGVSRSTSAWYDERVAAVLRLVGLIAAVAAIVETIRSRRAAPVDELVHLGRV